MKREKKEHHHNPEKFKLGILRYSAASKIHSAKNRMLQSSTEQVNVTWIDENTFESPSDAVKKK